MRSRNHSPITRAEAQQGARNDCTKGAPELLWHYTTFTGFISIINEKRMRATHSSHLNDYTEGKPLGEFVRAVLRRLVEHGGSPTRMFTLKRLSDSVAQYRAESFVICFSEAGDRLDNWRSYVRGPGVALGFSLESLARWSPFELGQIDYKPPDFLEREVESHIEAWCEMEATEGLASPRHDQLFRELDYFLNRKGALLKHDAFHGELEWRLLLPQQGWGEPLKQGKMLFRAGPTGVVPYVMGPEFRGDALRAVKLGPGSSESLGSVRLLLTSHGFGEVMQRITLSEVPWRAV